MANANFIVAGDLEDGRIQVFGVQLRRDLGETAMTRTFGLVVLAWLALATSWLDAGSAFGQEMLTSQNANRRLHCALPFTWSNTLVAAAQTWANKCTHDPNNPANFAHDPNARANGQGENLAWGTGNFTAQSAVNLWYGEGSQYNYSAPGFSSATGHFTQMVWKGSTQLGCAMANCSGETLWVCRYSPAGNITNPGQFQQNVLPTSCRR
jgi:hypothetical protein